MNVPVQHVYFALVSGLLILGLVIELIRRALLQERYAALWVVVALVFMTYGWWFDAAAAFASWLHVAEVVPIILFFGICLCALLILQLSVKISEFSTKIKNLIQEVSLLKHEMQGHERSGPKPGGTGDEDA